VPASFVVATTELSEDDAVVALARDEGIDHVRGPVEDVLSRFLMASEGRDESVVIRLTGDCPLLDPAVIARTVAAFESQDVDYLSSTLERTLPRGLDVEVFSASALRRAGEEAEGIDRVHVTSYLYRHPERFRVAGLTFEPHAGDLRVTLDTAEDAAALDAIVRELGDRPPAWTEVVDLLRRRPDIAALNSDVVQKDIEEG
jgi:spore coat polysaccharide biosynthesis protein SpsF